MGMIDTDDGRLALRKMLAFIVDNREHFEAELGYGIDDWTHEEWSQAAESAYFTMVNVNVYLESGDPIDESLALEEHASLDILYYLIEETGLFHDDVFSCSSVFELCGEDMKYEYDHDGRYED